MEDTNCHESTPKWFYRSDDDPLNTNHPFPEWTEFPDSKIIEIAYFEYMNAVDENYNIGDYKIYNISELTYSIDFELNIQFQNQNKNKSRLIGRFLGDPMKKGNTLQNKDIRFHLLERKASNIVLSKILNIKSSLILNSNQAFIDYLFLDLVFKITEKSHNYDQAQDDKTKVPKTDQAKEHLYMYSAVYINHYEKDKKQQFSELKLFKNDIFDGNLQS
jgi:hypothetical protein